MSTASYRGIYVPATRPDLQTFEHRLEKNGDMNTLSTKAGLGPYAG